MKTITGFAIAVDLEDGSDAGTRYWHVQSGDLKETLFLGRADARRHMLDLSNTRWKNQRIVRVTISIDE